MTVIRLTLKLHRYELVGSAAAVVIATAAALWALQQLTAATPPLACLQDPSLEEGCEGTVRFYELVEAYAAKVFVGMAVLPFLAGILLGAPLVAQEVERQTAVVAWSLSPSRFRWLTERVVLLLAALVLLVSIPAMVTQFLEAARAPQFDPATSFQDHGLRGLPLLARAVAAFGLAVAAGALAGRTLSGLLLGVGFGVVLALTLSTAKPFWPTPDRLPANGTHSDALVTRVGYSRGGSEILSWEQAISQAPAGLLPRKQADWIYEHFEVVALGYLPARYPEVVAREMGFLFLVGATALGAGAVVVNRRRPY